MNHIWRLLRILIISWCQIIFSLPVTAQSVSYKYKSLQKQICAGWNTWSYGSMFTQVLLPEGLGLSLHFRQSFIGTPGASDFLLSDAVVDKTNLIKPVAHTVDGAYTCLLIDNWHGNTIQVESASDQEQLYVLITRLKSSPAIHYDIELEVGMLWNRKGFIEKQGQIILATTAGRQRIIRSIGNVKTTYQPYHSPYLVLKGDSVNAFYTGSLKSIEEIRQIVNHAKNKYQTGADRYGELSESFKAIQTVLGWNTVYDPEQKRAITPVSRAWNKAWQGYVLFEWDTFFASYLFGLYDKNMAYSNAIAVTKGINKQDHLGHWQMPGRQMAIGMSQPPVGSMICWKLYEKYHEPWFLEEVYRELLSWNRWWDKNRNNRGKLSWGGWKGATPQIAAWESGMDNSPMYDNANMRDSGEYALQNIWDVGLNALYVNDCQYLAKIATILKRGLDIQELCKREKQYKEAVLNLWNDSAGIFLNQQVDNKDISYRLSPTLFYPLIAGIPSPDQANRMIKLHFYNPREFYSDLMLPSISFNDKDFNNDYWKGSVWPPLNFLTYLGLREYDRVAAHDLAFKSFKLFKKAWWEQKAVYENINSIDGISKTAGQSNSDPYYHWGALMGIMEFLEEGRY